MNRNPSWVFLFLERVWKKDKKGKKEKKKEEKDKSKKKDDKEKKDKTKSGKTSAESTPNKRDSAIEADLQVDEIIVENVKETPIKDPAEENLVSEKSPVSDEEEKAVKDEAEKENKLKLSFSKKSKPKSSDADGEDKKKKDDGKKQKDLEKKQKEREAKEEEAKGNKKEKEEKEEAKRRAKEEKKQKEKEAKEKREKEKLEKSKKKSDSKLDKKGKSSSPEKDNKLEEKEVEDGTEENKSKEDIAENKDKDKSKSKESLQKEPKGKKSKLSLTKIVKKKSKKDNDSSDSSSSSSSEEMLKEYGNISDTENISGTGGIVTSTPNRSFRGNVEGFPAESSKDVSFSSETAVLELDNSPYSSPRSKQRPGVKDEVKQPQMQKEAEALKGPTVVTESSTTAASSVTTSSSKHISGTEVTTSPEKGITSTKTSKTNVNQEKTVTQQVTKSSRVMTGTLEDVQSAIVKTEAIKYDPSTLTNAQHSTTSVPLVATETRKVNYPVPPPPQFESEGVILPLSEDGEIVSSSTVSSKTKTVETITYKMERDGVVETRVEQKITIQSDGDPIDHDRALAEAIQEATMMNPDMTVEKIEIQQQSSSQ